jgi:class 3 adenylate cyclase/predicted ATPase
VKQGHRGPPTAGEGQDPALVPDRAGERRQLTALFADLVNSTALSSRLDPEETRRVIRAYHSACAAAVAPFDGYIAQTLGDGLLVYFGYPEAHEDDAQRAIRGALSILEAVTAPHGELRRLWRECAVRIGVHTGLVVADARLDRFDSSPRLSIVGETPSIAAHLQQLADRNQIVIGPSTRHLIEGFFELEPQAPRKLPGLPLHMPTWVVQRETPPDSRFQRSTRRVMPPMVGRENELARLVSHWRRALLGHGQLVVISGAAGIGKSRLAQALREAAHAQRPIQIHYQCSPYYRNTALQPIIAQLQHAARLERDDSPEAKLCKLRALLAESSNRLEHDTALIGHLLHIPNAAQPALIHDSPERVIDDTIDALNAQLLRRAAAAPLLVSIEDAHWIDPTSLHCFARLLQQAGDAQLLAVVTHRGEMPEQWAQLDNAAALTLERLAPSQCRSIVEHLSAERPLPARVTEAIVARGDGIPFFVEELAKAVLESAGGAAPLSVPSSLQDSLMARLDRIGPLKVIAQLGACVGRSFSYRLLTAIAELDETRVQRGLERLVSAELLTREGELPDATFTFKHALVQSAAYESTLRSARRRVHARIAAVLEAQYPELCDQQPEVLAQHLGAAFDQAAVSYWLRAGQLAQRRSAHREAIAHLGAGLSALRELVPAERAARLEVDFQSALARSYMAGEGWSGVRVHSAYTRARLLCRSAGDTRRECEMLWGLCAHHTVRGEFAAARKRADEYVAVATLSNDRSALLMADSAALLAYFCLGEFAIAQRHADRIHALYRPEEDRGVVLVYNHDPEVIASMYEGFWLWVMGYPDRALRSSQHAVAHARALRHPFQLCYALINGAAAAIFRQEHAAVLALVDEGLQLSRERRLPFIQSYGPVLACSASFQRDPSAAKLAELDSCMERLRSLQVFMHAPLYLGQLAAAHARHGQLAVANRLLDEAQSVADATGERWSEPELHRLRAEFALRDFARGADAAEHWLRLGIARANRLGARGFELRLASDLTALLARMGAARRAEARDALEALYRSFDEGHDTSDLLRARSLLQQA